MEDAIKVVSTKFKVSAEVLSKVSEEHESIGTWMTLLGAYVLDNDRKQEEQKSNENSLRRQRLNAEHQLSQLEKQLISCNGKLTKYEKSLLDVKTKFDRKEEYSVDLETKYNVTQEENKLIKNEIAQLKQKYTHLENEKVDFAEILEKKSKEIDRLTEEWNEISKRLSDANKDRYELQYKLDEIKNSEIRKEFKEKRLGQEKLMLTQQIEQLKKDIEEKTSLAIEFRKDNMGKVIHLETKNGLLVQENEQLKKILESTKKTSKDQEVKIAELFAKMKRAAEEHIEAENNIQQELTSQSKLVELYKEDRDHAKKKLDEVMTAVSELQKLVKEASEEKIELRAKLQSEEEEHTKKLEELSTKLKQQATELENANDLLQLSKKKGGVIETNESISIISPMAAASSAILKKGMTLTQIYSEYVKVLDDLTSERDENSRLKLYMEQILQEVEEKAPLLMKQKEDYEHATDVIQNMSVKMEGNIKECYRLKNEYGELERNLNFHKREEKRLRTLCVDLSQQVRILLKEVEEARGGVVSSTSDLPELMGAGDALNSSSAGAVISEHLVTFKSIEELQEQNERLLLTVRQLSEEQEKLEQEGGPEIIQELKKKIENAKFDLSTLQENQKTQEEMMQQLQRQRDMYKVLCQKGGVMVGDVSSTLGLRSQLQMDDIEGELSVARAELNKTTSEHMKLKEEMAGKVQKLQTKIDKQEGKITSLKLECGQVKNELKFSEEKYSILQTTSQGFKKEAKALEEKCKSINEAYVKTRVEAETYKQDYNNAKDKMVAAEVAMKTYETEKNLLKESEKRMMQENQSLLDQQRSQNVLLTNLQTIQNNLERQEFETRKTLSRQVEAVQREMRALRRHSENEEHQLKLSRSSIEIEARELSVKLGIVEEQRKTSMTELQVANQQVENLDAKCKELEALNNASTNRLTSILEGDSTAKAKDDSQHELERYKTRVRELEVELSTVSNSKKGIKDQLEVMKKHLEQYKEIGDSNEQAISDLTKAKEVQVSDYERKLAEALKQVKNYKAQITAIVAEKLQLKKSNDAAEKTLQAKIAEVRQQSAPLERRYQDVTKALVNAKNLENAAKKESKEQCNIAKEAQDKYERELVLHAKDVKQLTILKDELKQFRNQRDSNDSQLAEMELNMNNNQKLMDQMKGHHQGELKKGEQVRKDLISQNSILHGQVEKLSAQLAQAKPQNRKEGAEVENSADKSIEEVYELLRFVRREKEIAETKAEASETESMRYRQRAEHLQRDLEETKNALELELERTKGLMLTEDEHKNMMEKVKKCKEFEVLIKELEKQKNIETSKNKALSEKNKKLDDEMKPLKDGKKSLENEKHTWLAEKTALKSEIERWTARTNQAVSQSAKTENEEVKKLQTVKGQNEKKITALQEDVKRTKQQLEFFKRESLKLKNENAENQNKIALLETDLVNAQSKIETASLLVPKASLSEEQQQEYEELQKKLEEKTTELTDKIKMVQQLKKLAKKYKTQSDKLQKVLKENSIDFFHVISGAQSGPSAAGAGEADGQGQSLTTAQIDPEDKKKLEEQLEEKIKTIDEITATITSLQEVLEVEKQEHQRAKDTVDRSQSQHIEAEKKLLEQRKEIEKVKNDLAEEKDKNEKSKKVFKTAKEKMASLTKQKDTSQQEVETLKKQMAGLRADLEQSRTAGNNTDQIKELNAQLEESKRLVEELSKERDVLTSQVEQLRVDLEKSIQEKRNAKNSLKAASQKKVRAPSVGSSKVSSEVASTVETISVAPLTATVRPTAAPSSQASKFYPQSTPRASIRPIAHTAPTAMISPSVPATQGSTDPSSSSSSSSSSVQAPPPVSIHPFIQQPPQMGEVQGRVRVQVQPQEMVPDHTPSGPRLQASSSTEESDSRPTTSKRQHVELEEPEESSTLEDMENNADEPGNKRQKTETKESQELIASVETDSQEGNIEEDELLAEAPEEEGDDDVMETIQHTQDYSAPSQLESVNSSREQRLLNERARIPSPHELMRQQQRSQMRGRSQLPSFSLPSQAGAVYYDDAADDSTVPSTPTLYVPKRTDGFAEAVSSPVVRFPTFSFSNNDQPSSSQTPALGQSGELVQQTRMDLLGTDEPASVPQTPVSVVPTGNLSAVSNSQTAPQPSEFQPVQFFSEDQGQEQNVPQQIDLTEDDDEGEVDNEGGDDTNEEEDNGELNYQLEEGAEEDPDDGVELFARDNDEDLGDEEGEVGEGEHAEVVECVESEESEEEEDSSDSEEEEEEETESGNERDIDEGDVVEIKDDDDDEEVEVADFSGGNERSDSQDEGDTVELASGSSGLLGEKAESSTASLEEIEDVPTTQSDQSKAKPVRLQRSTATGTRRRLRRDHLQGRPAKPKSS